MSASQPSKPTIIGLYGTSGCGKSYLLKQLKQDATLQAQRFVFYDGSELIVNATPGGLDAYKAMGKDQREGYVRAALTKLSTECQARQETAVVAGHLILCVPAEDPKEKPVTRNVRTDKDWETYTHMIHLNVDPHVVKTWTKEDDLKTRPKFSPVQLRDWQIEEGKALREICLTKNIPIASITVPNGSVGTVTLLRLKAPVSDFQQHTEATNKAAVEGALGTAPGSQQGLEKVILLDADKTLAPQDTGILFM
jgi:GTPase SAR1 family protein